MEKDQSPVTGRLVDLTLEIIYLLTGEYYKVVKETSGEPLTPSTVSAVTWPPPQVNSGKKILEVMQKMTRLLTEEVGVKYLDITREDYIEGRKDLYKDVVMEDEPDGSRKRNPPQRCPRPRDSTQEGETIPQLGQDKEFKVIKIKEEEHELAVNEARQFIEMGDPENSCDSMTDNSSTGNNEDEKLRDIIEEDEEKERNVLAEEQKDIGVKNEEGGTSARRAQKSTKAGQAKQQKDIGVKNEEEGTLVSRAQQSTEEEHVTIVKIEEEESPLHVDTHGRHVWNVPEEHHLVSPANDLMQYSPGAIVITLNHQTSMDPSNFQGPFITQTGTVVLNHEDSHTGKGLFACLECNKTFTKKRNLRRHEKIHAAGRPTCLECGKFFICEEQLLTHQTTIHHGEQPYTCLVCRKGFTAKKSLLRHLKIHTGERPFSCPVCGRCFVNKGNLASHQKIHVMEHTFPCSECGKSFICEKDLNEHEKIHMGDRPYSCSDCDKSFPVKSSLLRHQKVHTGNRPEGGNSSSHQEDHVSHQEDHVSHQEDHVSHQEDHVSHQEDHVSHQEVIVSHQEDHVSHQTIYTGELPYFCAVCGECFTEEKELRIHQRIHTQALPYKCSNCGESFLHIEELHTHRNSCLESGKSSVEEKEHPITDHTEERPYSCLKCEESFSQIDDLITHQKCHPETDSETFNPEAKRKRRSYEAAFKLLVVARAEESNNRIASKQFCVHEKQVRDWRNMKDDLIRIPKDKKAKRGLTTRYEALEAELHKWVMECRQMGQAVTRREIRLRALQMAKDEQLQIPGIERFVASGGWCTRFMNRFSLCTRQTTKKLPEDLDEKLMSFHSFIVNQRMIHNYDLGDIGNMDEIPMTFDLPSNRTVPSLGDETMLLGTTGNEKNHFTVVLSCLANGIKLRPVVIFKRNTLPEEVEFPPRVTVHTHGKGWIDEERTKEWMEDIWNTRPGAASNKPSLLVWDRFRVHTSNDIKALAKASQVTLAFIPGGLTSVLQPLHVCLKQPFKDRVKKLWREWMSSDQVQPSLAGDVMKPDIELIATWVRDAWEEIPEDLVQRAFKKCGISNAMDGSEEGALHENDSGDDCEFSDDDNVYADTLTPANAEALFGHTDNEDNEEESGFEGL